MKFTLDEKFCSRLGNSIGTVCKYLSFCPQGITLVKELIDVYGMDVVQAYMSHIQVMCMYIYARNQ